MDKLDSSQVYCNGLNKNCKAETDKLIYVWATLSRPNPVVVVWLVHCQSFHSL